jgi:hypothetical protein
MQYKNVLFNVDMAGIKLTMGQAKKVSSLRSSKGWPDIFIPEPRGLFHGLYIELKKDGTKLYKKDGITPATDHIAEQINLMKQLYLRGYSVHFAIGFYEVKEIIDKYFAL